MPALTPRYPLARVAAAPVLARRRSLLCAALALSLALAGCGGGAPKATTRSVTGDGFSFAVAPSWAVSSVGNTTAATGSGIDRVEVIRFALEKPYRAALFPGAARELDAVISRLATRLSARVVTRATVRLAGERSRSYRLLYGHGRTQEIAFVLSGLEEYELLCRRLAATPDASCRAFFASFVLR